MERFIYRVLRVDPEVEHGWRTYLGGLLAFNAVGLHRPVRACCGSRARLPFNPEGLPGVSPWIAFNTAVSFVTNTNWQAYGGESTMSYLSQFAGLTVQNFVSAAVGMAAAAALIRAIARRNTDKIGNFWVDLVRSNLYVLLPISLLFAFVLVSQGVVQNFDPYTEVATVEGAAQVIPGGPAASQIAIKDLGTNGGGFFNANSAHPFENPTPLSNAVIIVMMLAIPAGLVLAYGRMTGRRRDGWAIYAAMTVLLTVMTAGAIVEETAAGAAAGTGADATASDRGARAATWRARRSASAPPRAPSTPR